MLLFETHVGIDDDNLIFIYQPDNHRMDGKLCGPGGDVALFDPGQARVVAAELIRLADEIEGDSNA